MKKIISIALVVALCLSITACGDSDTKELERNKGVVHCFGDTVISDNDYDEEKINVALTDFAVHMFKKDLEDLEESENILISPISIIMALGMTSYGAQEVTLAQMEEVLGVNREYLNRYNYEYISNCSEKMKIANSIWFTNDERLTVNDAFLQFNEEFYGSDIYETAFNNATVDSINAWVEDKTDGTIKNILDEIPDNAVMYLINALAFEAEWEEKYDSTQIKEGKVFTTSNGIEQKVDMMYSTESLYLEDENATGVIKYYKDRDYAFVALLPNEGVSIHNYIKSLSGEKLNKLLSNYKEVKVDTWIPQFTTEYEVEMSSVLKEMGMTDIFDVQKADLTGLGSYSNENIYINRILHKTFIEVSPVGTKAGAATVVELLCGCVAMEPEDVKEVYLDRPFIYMIIDCESNQPIFMGTVNSIE